MATATATPSRPVAPTIRQQLLLLWLSHPNPGADTIAWSLFDGTGGQTRMSGDQDEPPYASVLAAMQDGWRVIQVASQQPPYPQMEHRTSYLPYEFVLERLMEVAHV